MALGSIVKGRIALAVCAAVVTVAYAIAHHVHPAHPDAANAIGWWGWFDQGHYYRAAMAWAHGDLNSERHWYLPGYALLAAPFCHLSTLQPFYIVNLACLLAFLFVFAALADALFPGHSWMQSAAAAMFTALTVGSYWFTKSFVEPWTTTPTAPLTCLSFLLGFRFMERPSAKAAALFALTTTSVALFRPTDVAVLTFVNACFGLIGLVRARLSVSAVLRVIAAAALGAIAPLLTLVGLHYATHGLSLGAYVLGSQRMGFAWALVLIRWVTLFISAKPLFPEGNAMTQSFPWIVPGIAGLALAAQQRSLKHLWMLSAIAMHVVVYLAYRDLHPQGLFRYNNYHYFKWTLPLFALYAAAFVAAFRNPRRQAVPLAISVLVTVALLFWRAEWQPLDGVDAEVLEPRTLVLRPAPASVLDAVRVSGHGDFVRAFQERHELHIGDQVYFGNDDLKLFPQREGFLFATLRPTIGGEARLEVASEVVLQAEPPPRAGRMRLVFGPPVWRLSGRLKFRAP